MAEGRTDSREAALTYLAALSHGMIDPEMAATYVDTGPEMIRFLEARTPVAFYSIPCFPDYHSEFPGAKREDELHGEPLLASGARVGRFWARGKSDRGPGPIRLVTQSPLLIVMAGLVPATQKRRRFRQAHGGATRTRHAPRVWVAGTSPAMTFVGVASAARS